MLEPQRPAYDITVSAAMAWKRSRPGRTCRPSHACGENVPQSNPTRVGTTVAPHGVRWTTFCGSVKEQTTSTASLLSLEAPSQPLADAPSSNADPPKPDSPISPSRRPRCQWESKVHPCHPNLRGVLVPDAREHRRARACSSRPQLWIRPCVDPYHSFSVTRPSPIQAELLRVFGQMRTYQKEQQDWSGHRSRLVGRSPFR